MTLEISVPRYGGNFPDFVLLYVGVDPLAICFERIESSRGATA